MSIAVLRTICTLLMLQFHPVFIECANFTFPGVQVSPCASFRSIRDECTNSIRSGCLSPVSPLSPVAGIFSQLSITLDLKIGVLPPFDKYFNCPHLIFNETLKKFENRNDPNFTIFFDVRNELQFPNTNSNVTHTTITPPRSPIRQDSSMRANYGKKHITVRIFRDNSYYQTWVAVGHIRNTRIDSIFGFIGRMVPIEMNIERWDRMGRTSSIAVRKQGNSTFYLNIKRNIVNPNGVGTSRPVWF